MNNYDLIADLLDELAERLAETQDSLGVLRCAVEEMAVKDAFASAEIASLTHENEKVD